MNYTSPPPKAAGIIKHSRGDSMKKFLFVVLAFAVLAGGCARNTGGPLVYKKFKDDHTLLIACRGNVKEGTIGVARFESAKRAALMNIYYFIRKDFGDSIDPRRDGSVKGVEFSGDAAVVHYVIKKKNIRSREK